MSTHNIPFLMHQRKKITLRHPKSAAMRYFQGSINEFKTATVDKPSVFEPLEVYCNMFNYNSM